MIFAALKRMRERGITDTKQFTWQLVYNENVNEYDEKENNYNNNKKENNTKEKLSQLIDINNNEMCKYGHGKYWEVSSEYKCIICGTKKETKYCVDCYYYAYDKGNKNPNQSDYSYCLDCRIKNSENIKKRIKMNNFKSLIIRNELLKNPSLEMDLLCNMKRRAALDGLIYDINKLDNMYRRKWFLMVMDLDYLKCWNSCLGHVKTDELIKKIGAIMKSNIHDINNGKWIDKEKGELTTGYCYRTGGDEFVIAINCDGDSYAACQPLGPFYNNIRDKINKLGLNIKDLFYDKNDNDFNANEWNETMKKLNNAKDRNGNKVNMSVVGISTGIYIPAPLSSKIKDSDWLSKGDKIALEHSKIMNAPKKNGVSIYYEEIGVLIADEKVLKCLEKGVYLGLK